jgi:hypothetical protein
VKITERSKDIIAIVILVATEVCGAWAFDQFLRFFHGEQRALPRFLQIRYAIREPLRDEASCEAAEADLVMSCDEQATRNTAEDAVRDKLRDGHRCGSPEWLERDCFERSAEARYIARGLDAYWAEQGPER